MGDVTYAMLDMWVMLPVAWWEWSCWGGSPINSAPLPVILFCLLVWDVCHVIGTTCNDCQSLCNTFGWMEVLRGSQQFHGRVLVEVQGTLPLEALKNFQLMVPKSGSNIAQQYVDGYPMFHVHCSTKSQQNPRGPKFPVLKFLIRKGCVCSIVLAG